MSGYSDAIDKMLTRKVNFLDSHSSSSPVVISSRIRLARNIKGFAFPSAATPAAAAAAAEVINAAVNKTGVLGDGALTFNIHELAPLDGEVLWERRLVSRELLECGKSPFVHVSGDEHLAVLVNEEDHLRMQAVLPGLQLHKAWQFINCLDDQLSCELDMAYDGTLGYLTSCPSNVGTGIRISVMLHLPALARQGHIKQLGFGLSKLGLTMRGMFGEGSENLGNFFQISNQSTLGESEAEIMDRLGRVIDQVIEHEESSRLKMLENERCSLMDMVGRCFGNLRYGYLLSGKEAFKSLSGLRLGVDMNMFSAVDADLVNELFVAVCSGHLQKKARRQLNERERDELRSEIVREKLKQSSAL